MRMGEFVPRICSGLDSRNSSAVTADPEIPERAIVVQEDGLVRHDDPEECLWLPIGAGLPPALSSR